MSPGDSLKAVKAGESRRSTPCDLDVPPFPFRKKYIEVISSYCYVGHTRVSCYSTEQRSATEIRTCHEGYTSSSSDESPEAYPRHHLPIRTWHHVADQTVQCGMTQASAPIRCSIRLKAASAAHYSAVEYSTHRLLTSASESTNLTAWTSSHRGPGFLLAWDFLSCR